MHQSPPKGSTAFYLTKPTYSVFRPGKTAKERHNGKWAAHQANLTARAQLQSGKR